jgi:hypothetical protein
MPGLCKYSDVFGEPGKGAHKYRIGGLAAVDLLATGGVAFLITRFALGRKDLLAYALVLIILVLAGVLLHEAFCVNTRIGAAIFGRDWPSPHPCLPVGSASPKKQTT